MEAGNRKETGIQVLSRTIHILEFLATSPEGFRLNEIAGHLGVPLQTAQSILRTLQNHGYVDQEGRGRPYVLGMGLFRLVQLWEQAGGFTRIAGTIVYNLAKRLNEYAILAELKGDSVRGIAEARADRELGIQSVTHAPEKTHCMATGKLLLAYLDEEALRPILSRLRYTLFARNSITSEEELRSRFGAIREKGYAVSRDESSEGVSAIAVPVRNRSGQVRLALGTYLPSMRFDEMTEKLVLDELFLTAKRIESLYG